MDLIPVVIGLGYGDEGKGTTVDYLCSEKPVDYVVRFSGGPQTAHNVVLADGREHTFAQFGSGTLQGAGTILGSDTLINPFNMAQEAAHLYALTGSNPFANTYISENALLITPLHSAANRQRELNRGGAAHGSCGEGIGEARSYAIYQTPDDPIVVKDILNRKVLERKMSAYHTFLCQTLPNFNAPSVFDDILEDYGFLLEDHPVNIVSDDFIAELMRNAEGRLVFEGSQGILLDESFGFHPHTTWSDITATNAVKMAMAAGYERSDLSIHGIMRTYMTRHGHGPMPSEFIAEGWETQYPEKHNAWGQFQGSWRVGVLDLPLLKYALEVQPCDVLVMSHCDIVPEHGIPVVVGGFWEDLLPPLAKDLTYQEEMTNMLKAMSLTQGIISTVPTVDELTAVVETALRTPVAITSYGPTAGDKKRI